MMKAIKGLIECILGISLPLILLVEIYVYVVYLL